MKKAAIVFLFVLGFMSAKAQGLSNLRTLIVVPDGNLVQIDSLSIVPSSVQVFCLGNLLSEEHFSVEFFKAQLHIDSMFIGKELLVYYRVFDFNLAEPVFRFSSDSLKLLAYNPFRFDKKKGSSVTSFEEAKIISNGVLSRGITFGNNQDMSVNAELHLSINGKINDELSIKGVITDKNIPFQADGYSQNINEFDRVFIQLFTKKNKLTAGDFYMKNERDSLLVYTKKLQGLNFQHASGSRNDYTLFTSTSAGVSKGKFVSNRFSGQEGNQGPYALNGENNEMYIVVLSGSEKVFLNGKLLERGQDRDYVIDYNKAEIIFTAKQLITKDSRLLIEFEYAEKNYTRFVAATENRFEKENMAFWVHFFSETDAKNQTISYELNQAEQQILALVGDNTFQAFSNRVDRVPYTPDEILYEKTDSLVNGVQFEVYVFSTNPDKAQYRLRFTHFGKNKGNYVLSNQLANGRVFRWVAPVNGIPQGEYEPVSLLVAPESLQVLNLGAERKEGAFQFKNSLSISNKDLNLFSRQDDENNLGFYYRFDGLYKRPNPSSAYRLESALNYEFKGDGFSSPERFLPVEFNRDWNLAESDSSANQHFIRYKLSLSDTLKNVYTFFAEGLKREKQFSALRVSSEIDHKKGSFSTSFNSSFLNSSGAFTNSAFFRDKLSIGFSSGKFALGLHQEAELNKLTDVFTDSLYLTSQSFFESGLFVEKQSEGKKTFRLQYTYRTDFKPVSGLLEAFSKSNSLGLSVNLVRLKNQSLSSDFAYRSLQFNPLHTIAGSENTFLSQMNYRGSFFRKGLVYQVYYELNSGMEAKTDFFYIQVSPGQGQYQWNDYNGNQLQELEEFERAEFSDQANYIRVNQVSKEMEKVLGNKINFTLSLKPEKIFGKSTDFLKFVSLFQSKFLVRADNKKRPRESELFLQPFVLEQTDSSLLSSNFYLQSDVTWHSVNRKMLVNYLVTRSRSKAFMVNGSDYQSLNYQSLRGKYTLSRQFSLTSEVQFGEKSMNSEYMNSKNYSLEYKSAELSGNFQSGMKRSVKAGYLVKEKNNLSGEEYLLMHKVYGSSFFNLGKNGKLNFNLSYVYNAYKGEENSSVSYEILEGLQAGNNALASLAIVKKISKYVELNLTYTGRINKEGDAIHNAGMQLRAVF